MEKHLTICRPIRDNDTFIIDVLSISNTPPIESISEGVKYINSAEFKIYTYINGFWSNGVFLSHLKLYKNKSNNKYYRFEKNKLVERDYVEFPEIGNPIELSTFTYSSQRMGKAPSITASAMWFNCLDDMWTLDCFVEFNGERYYLDETPTSSKSNEDARYKHDLSFTSERQILENIYLFDVVTPYITEKPTSESITFSFFGDIEALRKRINVSLVNSGISKYVFRQGVTSCPTLKEWNSWKLEPITPNGHRAKYEEYNGDYSAYLQSEIYQYSNGEFLIDGYQVKIGNDKDGVRYKSEEKLLSFDKSTIFDALQSIDEIFEIKYYFKGKEIWIADSETFFKNDYFEYGCDKALLSATKSNDTEKVINKCSGIGSSDNIPYFYPNPCEDGFLGLNVRNDSTNTNSTIKADIITKNGYTSEKYFKNHLSDSFIYGDKKQPIPTEQSIYTLKDSQSNISHVFYHVLYEFQVENNGNFYFDSNFPVPNTKLDISAFYTDDYVNIIPSNFAKGSIISVNKKGKILITLQQQLSDLAINHVGYYSDINEILNEHTYTPCFLSKPNAKPGVYIKTRERENHTEWNYDEHLVYIEDLPEFMNSIQHSSLQIILTKTVYIYKENGVNYYTEPIVINDNEQCIDCNTLKIYKYNSNSNPTFTIINNSVNYQKICDVILNERKLNLCFYQDGWFKKHKQIKLEDYGIKITGGTPQMDDIIEFKRLKYLTIQEHLMPEVYYKTDGEQRFYKAKNYPINGTQDEVNEEIGEEFLNGKIRNPIYHDDKKVDKPNEYNQYFFTNEFSLIRPKEHIEEFSDIKPSIVDMKYKNRLIDIVQTFAYDEFDNNETWSIGDGETTTLEYKHPHFYAKLRPLGFNLFDCKIDSGDMELNLTTGNCGSCKFKIKVDESTLKNPVQVWEFDVYEKDGSGQYKIAFKKGDLKRIYLTRDFYKKNADNTYEKINTLFTKKIYSREDILNDKIGSIKQGNKTLSEGDIINYGVFQDVQQDTTDNYVWVALEKDINTYGVIMPSANPVYDNGVLNEQLSSYIRPISYEDDHNHADKFVLTHILLPQFYIREAEKKLSKAIVKYMADHNNWKFNFSIHFSRIYLAQNPNILNLLNENSKLNIKYNGYVYTVYVSSYSYKMSENEPLPDITIDLRETINTIQYNILKKLGGDVISKDIDDTIAIKKFLDISDKRYIPNSGDVRIKGNLTIGKKPTIVNMDIDENKEFQKRINVLKLDGDSETDGINVMRNKQKIADKTIVDLIDTQKITAETVDSIAKSKSELIERSNDLKALIDNLDNAIIEFNTNNDGIVKPIDVTWHCLNKKVIGDNTLSCKQLDDLKDTELKPLSE